MYLVPSKIHIRLLLQESFYIPKDAFFLTFFGMIILKEKQVRKMQKRDKSGNIHFDTRDAINH